MTNKIHLNFFKILNKYRHDRFLIPVYKSFKDKDIEELDIDFIFSGIDKKLFFTKVFKVLFLLYKKKMNRDVGYIHAHTLISDGIPAYILSILIKKQYIITVRGTDVHYFIAKSALFKSIAKRILSNAALVFFVSPSYRDRVKVIYPNLDHSKFLLLPNGVDPFWIDNLFEKRVKSLPTKEVKLLFVGKVTEQKNLGILIEFLKKYNDRSYCLTIVGPNVLGWDFDEISSTIKPGNSINFLGEVKEKEELLNLYRSNDIFIMLSPAETFGVVYVEALTQGLPIIYTRGDGIDGYFEEGYVGYSCDHTSLVELKKKVDLVLINYSSINTNTTVAVKQFEWNYLIKKYLNDVNATLSMHAEVVK